MKQNFLLMSTLNLLVVLTLMGCKSNSRQQPEAVEMEALKIVEEVVPMEVETVLKYIGKLPSADCPGIHTALTLKWTNQSNASGNMYELEEKYIGKNTFYTTGEFNVERGYKDDKDATLYILDFKNSAKEQRYYVSFSDKPEVLHVLDPKKEMIKSKLNYTLKKVE